MKKTFVNYAFVASVLLLAAGLFMAPISRVSVARAADSDEYLNRCGCSQNVLRRDGNRGDQDRFCEDEQLKSDSFDLYASRPKVPNPIGGALSILGFAVKIIFGSIDGEKGQWTREFVENQSTPEVVLQVGNDHPQQGDIVKIVAENRNFIRPSEDKTNQNNQAITPPQKEYRYTVWAKDGVTMQGVVAGGKEVQVMGKLVDASGNQIGSNPNGVYINKDSCRLVTRIPEIDIDQDRMDDQWEKDHFPALVGDVNSIAQLQRVNPAADSDLDGFKADNPKRLIGNPVRNNPLFGEAITLAPDSDGGFTGDGKFTNLEEFIWGTDPNNKDTDNDGTTDEADVSGLNQGELVVPISGGTTESQEIRATTLGYTLHRRNYIVSSTAKLIVNNRDPLKTIMSMVPQDPDIEHLPVITATITNPQSPANFLSYTWELNGAQLPPEFQGKGKSTLNIALVKDRLNVTGTNKVEVSIFDEVTTQMTFGTQEIQLGKGALLTFAKLAVDDHCSADPCSCEPDLNGSTTEIGPDQYVRVQAAGNVLTSSDADKLNYVWTLDLARDQQSSGFGKTTMCFKSNEKTNYSHSVKLSVINQLTGRIEATDEIAIPVNGFAADLVVSPSNEVGSGERVDLHVANIRNTPSGGGALTFSWKLDGSIVSTGSSNPTLSFTTGLPGTIHSVSVTIQTAGSAGIGRESLIKTTTIHVLPDVNEQANAQAPEQTKSLVGGLQASLNSLFSRFQF